MFHYERFNPDWLAKTLEAQTIHCSNPNNLNDPWACVPCFDAPTAVALITTEEIPTTVRRLADGAGVYVFASSDLFYLLGPALKKHTVKALRALIKKESKMIPTLA